MIKRHISESLLPVNDKEGDVTYWSPNQFGNAPAGVGANITLEAGVGGASPPPIDTHQGRYKMCTCAWYRDADKATLFAECDKCGGVYPYGWSHGGIERNAPRSDRDGQGQSDLLTAEDLKLLSGADFSDAPRRDRDADLRELLTKLEKK